MVRDTLVSPSAAGMDSGTRLEVPNRLEPERSRILAVAALLVLVTLAVYVRLGTYGFLDFDDPAYVFDNPHVRAGLTREGIVWAFTTSAEANWTPLAWLSHMLDVQIFGLQGRILGLPASGWHHLENLAWHAGSAVVLFLFLRDATGALARSAVVAFLFAVHPLNVEAVAWVSARKDVLSTFFGFSCLLAYVHYRRGPSAWRHALVGVLLALGLLAKSMIVTLPFVMLLLDAWPLRAPKRRWLEKIPWFALSFASCAATLLAHGASSPLKETAPLGLRLQNACVQYAIYCGKVLWPTDLAVLYPYPGRIATDLVVAAASFLAIATAVAVLVARRRPYVGLGWFWFLGTMLPVIGLFQVALHARADRYAYLPAVGLFVTLVWTAAAAFARAPRLRPAVAAAALVACAAASRNQLGHWSDTVSLFRHTVAVTANNGWAHRILGTALAGEGRNLEAIPEYREALRLWPGDPIAHNNLACALEAQGRLEDAIREYEAAVRLDPDNTRYRGNLDRALAKAARATGGVRRVSSVRRRARPRACPGASRRRRRADDDRR
jgi:tetratricopeptide (TPR) repeat protein